ncbi:hypothetical protein XCR_4291 [Xanthomonas campestris pv. raphani 756C]|nr:hypothetical protein XCR_4291 [Xanthomonas campestris pv. raphani 756C]
MRSAQPNPQISPPRDDAMQASMAGVGDSSRWRRGFYLDSLHSSEWSSNA